MVQKQTKWFFLEPFLTTRDSIHLNEISRRLKKPHTIVRRYLLEFEKEGILKKDIRGRQTLYSLNNNFPLFIDILTIAEKEKLISWSRESFLLGELISELHVEIDLPCLIFGSFALRENSKAKDIDLLIVGKITKKIEDGNKKIEEKLNKKIHLIGVCSFEEISLTLKKEILSKHLIINNPESILKWLR